MTPTEQGIEMPCLHCKGRVMAALDGLFGHSWPTCAAFDAVKDSADAADFLREHRLAYTPK